MYAGVMISGPRFESLLIDGRVLSAISIENGLGDFMSNHHKVSIPMLPCWANGRSIGSEELEQITVVSLPKMRSQLRCHEFEAPKAKPPK